MQENLEGADEAAKNYKINTILIMKIKPLGI